MPQGLFIDPNLLQKALKPGGLAVPKFDAGPSAPHTEGEVDDPPALGWPNWQDWLPDGMTPTHYTEHLDPIWAEFDDVEERTAERLQALLDEVGDEALKVHMLSVEVFQNAPTYKLPASERDRFRNEFLAYGKRLNGYRETLAALDPKSTATDDVYIGLVQTKKGAGPVPDVIMHLYFAKQLGILADHADDMGKGFVGRSITAIEKVGTAIGKVTDKISDRVDDEKTELEKSLRRAAWIIGGVLTGGVLVVGGLIVLAMRAGRQRETIVVQSPDASTRPEGSAP